MAILWGDILLLQLGHSEVWSVLWLKVSQLSALGSGASCSISDEQGREAKDLFMEVLFFKMCHLWNSGLCLQAVHQ